MKAAIIDLGTNTFNLLIVDIDRDGTYKSLFKTKIPVKLGEGSINKKVISPAAFNRGISALKSHKAIIDRFKVTNVFAFATSAIRSSKNGPKFIKSAKDQTGIEIKPITGEKEAELIYKGVRQALDIGDKPSLLMDIGGGSNEFVIGTSTEIFWKKSYDLGMARLLDMFKPSDPISPAEVEQIEEYLLEQLTSLFDNCHKYNTEQLIGSSGSFDSFAEMICYRFHNIDLLKDKTEYTFNLDEYFQIHELLLKSSKEERLKIKGLVEMRVDMIVLASILVNLVLKKTKINTLRLSAYSLKEGVLAEVIK